MPTLVQRLQEITATTDDDFFAADTLTFYLNKAQDQVTSYLLNKERTTNNSVRGLDKLRQILSITEYGTPVQINSRYWKGVVNVGSLLHFTHLVYDSKIPLRELNSKQLVKLHWGNIQPSAYEGYFYVTYDGGVPKFEVYLHENPETTTKTTLIYSIKQPTVITSASTTLTELPTTLENAVLYGASRMMIMQEGIKDPTNNLQAFDAQFKTELELNGY